MVEKENKSFTSDETYLSSNSPGPSVLREKNAYQKPTSGSLIYQILLRTVEFAILLLVGAVVVFILVRRLPGDPWTMMLGGGPITSSQLEAIEAMKVDWGYYQPIIAQFFIYLGHWLRGDFGISLVGSTAGLSVTEVIASFAPRTAQLIVVAIIFAAIPAIVVGIIAGLKKGTWFDKLSLGLAAAFFILPICGIGVALQYLFAVKTNLLPATLYISVQNYNYPFDITGWSLIDPLIKGDPAVFADAFSHIYLPLSVMAYAFYAIGVVAVRRLVIIFKAKQAHLPRRNYVRTGLVFLVISALAVSTETIFNLQGSGMLLIAAIVSQDFFVVAALLFRSVFLFMIIAYIVDLVGILVGYFVKPRNSTFEKGQELKGLDDVPTPTHMQEGSQPFSQKVTLNRQFLRKLVMDVSIIIGATLLLAWIILALIAPSLYAFNEIAHMDPSSLPWAAPDSTHLLGTTVFGRDVMGRALWGVVVPISQILPWVFIASVIGIVLGVTLSVKNYILDDLVNLFAKFLLVVPTLPYFLIPVSILGMRVTNSALLLSTTAFSISLLLGHRIIPKQERPKQKPSSFSSNLVRYLPKILSEVFLVCVIALMVYFTVSFLGFSDPTTINWAGDLGLARSRIYDAPWAVITPMVAIFLFLLPLILLSVGFFNSASEIEQDIQENAPFGENRSIN